ncbi:alcohol dehydrogenase [Blastopirellula marina]|uniref:Alcohol dehydrogenase n=1 Tax=Blastopirellula marina TaxID=124 RepID=A0A2S8F0U1_9BACT|nr:MULTISPECIES: phosphonoacetaldehyde reductase [Pirellulaceae]PQO25792.1 alcohol dehydrogenase [Blastopirellula marina]RCS43475.1 iron-containing alcohol dehydrogenase family protein [Bremerella cremea]
MQTVYLAEGSLARIPQIFQQLGAVRTFLVVDEVAYNLSGAAAQLRQFLPPDAITLFSGFEPNPKIEDVQRGVAKCRAADPDLVLALGGGTAIDLAKMIASMSRHEESPRDIVLNGISLSQGTLPLVAIPTTAGTGSESTHFAVVYVDGQKYSVADPCLLPCVAVVDPELTYSVPPRMTAATGLDAFCQAIESIWAVGATDESVAYATSAATLAFEHLPAAVNAPTPESRHAMSLASHLAGKAINISKTTLPHAISYAITADYGIPHGAAVATTLSSVLAYNFGVSKSDCADERGTTHVRQRLLLILDILKAATVEQACHQIEAFVSSLGCNPTLASAGIQTDESLRVLASRVNPARLSNNPRMASQEELFSLLQGRKTVSTGSRRDIVPTKATAG